MKKVLISNNPENLEKTLKENSTLYSTVEAEYGSTVVKGTVATLAHHVKEYRACPAPCAYKNEDYNHLSESERQLIGVSHFDLDTLGGVLAIFGNKPEKSGFWECAAWVDIHGPHRLKECPEYSEKVELYLNAYWAWSEKNRCFPPRGGSVEDVTGFFQNAACCLKVILLGDVVLLEAGRQWAAEKVKIEKQSFKSVHNDRVLLRSYEGVFVNHLYGHDGQVYDAIVGFNTITGRITLSFERPGIGNACEIMQQAFGSEAGGHAVIAGSPWDKQYSFETAVEAAKHIAAMLGTE